MLARVFFRGPAPDCRMPLWLARRESGASVKSDPSTEEIDKIIRTFAANEAEFAKRGKPTPTARLPRFRRSKTPGSRVAEWEIVSDIVFEASGRRTERSCGRPWQPCSGSRLSPEDEQDLRNVLPFVLTSNEIDNYHVRYLGRQNADEMPCYVFAVKPKKMVPGKRYFVGPSLGG